MNIIINFFRGICMALADSVPGVSGGTIAFVLGFYDKFINSLESLIYGDWKEKKLALRFLIKLGFGWVFGMVLAVLILTDLFETHIYSISSLFIGFIIFSLPLIYCDEKENIKGKYQYLIFTLIGILIVSLITYFNPVSGTENVVDIASLNIGLALYIFVAAMVAISAMVLPGISGSTLLLIFGLYIPIMTGIKELLHLNMEYLIPIIIFGLGVLTGVGTIIKTLKVALEKYRSQLLYTIFGLMIGSIYAIVMGPTTLENSVDPLSLNTFSIIYFILGGLIMLGLEKLKRIIAKKAIQNNDEDL